MRLSLLFSSVVLFCLFLSVTAQATSLSPENSPEGYKLPTYDKIDFKAEYNGEHNVYMNWSAFTGHNDEQFKYYKVIRSHGNPNPLYPEDSAIKYFENLGNTRYTDENAWKSAYYRVCAITDVKGRHCSNAVWIEVKKNEKYEEKINCKSWSVSGNCQETEHEWAERKEKERFKWEQQQNEAKARLEAKKQAAKKMQQHNLKKWEQERANDKERQEQKQSEWQKQKAHKEMEIWNRLYQKLDTWLGRFEERLQQANLTNNERIEKIEAVQQRFYTWEEGKEMRMRMVDYIDKSLNEWKATYSQDEAFGDVDSFLEGLLD